MFNENDYNENVEYCKYVFDENKRLRLELDNNEIQVVANLYVDELVDNDIDPYESIVKNELMLLDTVDFYKLEIKEEKISPYDVGEGRKRINDKAFKKIEEELKDREGLDDLHFKKKAAFEKRLNAHGLYDRNDLNPDDESLYR